MPVCVFTSCCSHLALHTCHTTAHATLQVDAAGNSLNFDHVDNLQNGVDVHERVNGCGNPNAVPILIRVWAVFGGIVLLMLIATVWRVGLKFKSRFL